MARRVITAGINCEFISTLGDAPWREPEAEEGEFDLISLEMEQIRKKARLTLLQHEVMRYRWRRHMTCSEIAVVMGRDPKTIATCLDAAMKKARQLPHIGVLTTAWDIFGESATFALLRKRTTR